MSQAETIVTVQDVYNTPSFNRATGFCAKGARAWFAANNLSWAEFVQHGLPASVLKNTGDPIALRVVAFAEQREETEYGRRR